MPPLPSRAATVFRHRQASRSIQFQTTLAQSRLVCGHCGLVTTATRIYRLRCVFHNQNLQEPLKSYFRFTSPLLSIVLLFHPLYQLGAVRRNSIQRILTNLCEILCSRLGIVDPLPAAPLYKCTQRIIGIVVRLSVLPVGEVECSAIAPAEV